MRVRLRARVPGHIAPVSNTAHWLAEGMLLAALAVVAAGAYHFYQQQERVRLRMPALCTALTD